MGRDKEWWGRKSVISFRPVRFVCVCSATQSCPTCNPHYRQILYHMCHQGSPVRFLLTPVLFLEATAHPRPW